jgi:hypothetical protein
MFLLSDNFCILYNYQSSIKQELEASAHIISLKQLSIILEDVKV